MVSKHTKMLSTEYTQLLQFLLSSTLANMVPPNVELHLPSASASKFSDQGCWELWPTNIWRMLRKAIGKIPPDWSSGGGFPFKTAEVSDRTRVLCTCKTCALLLSYSLSMLAYLTLRSSAGLKKGQNWNAATEVHFSLPGSFQRSLAWGMSTEPKNIGLAWRMSHAKSDLAV